MAMAMAIAKEPNPTKKQPADTHDEYAARYDSANPLVSLPPDALISILSRVPSRDHGTLWQSCRTLRAALDSDAYVSERAASGWAEVTVRLVPGLELYDRDGFGDDASSYHSSCEDSEGDGADHGDLTEEEQVEKRRAKKERREERRKEQRLQDLETYFSDLGHLDDSYGYEDITVDVSVDGVLAGEISLVLVPRGGRDFHGATDAHSSELQEVGWSLCHRRGRPKVRSIKEADLDGKARSGGFLHVKRVRIRQAYRPSDNTDVVGRALRAAVTIPELEWTLATAMSDARVYMTKEDNERRGNFLSSEHSAGEGGTDVALDTARAQEKKRHAERWTECATLDARTFLQIGYKQIPEVAYGNKDGPVWCFALPRFLERPIMSREDAAGIKFFEHPDLPPEPIGLDQELLTVVMSVSNARKAVTDSLAPVNRLLAQLEQTTREQDESEVRAIEQFQETEADIAADFVTIERDARATSRPDIMARMQEFRARHDATRSAINVLIGRYNTTTFEQRCAQKATELNNIKESVRDKIHKRDHELKANVAALVNKGASIQKSYALHCSARFLLTEYIDFLLGLVPANDRAAAINSVDMTGCTPLHCALIGTPDSSSADLYYRAVQHLLGLGANKNIVDTSGRTPLGQYRMVARSRNDYDNAFDLTAVNAAQGSAEESGVPIHQRMEEALMPPGGETDADRDAKGDEVDESGEEEDSDMEMDFDEEDDSDEEED